MIRRVILICLLFDFSADAWTLESPSRMHRGRCDIELFASTTNNEETTCLSRRSLLKFAPAIAGLTTLPSFAGAEVDPFAAMDDMLSSGAVGPGNSSNNNSSSKPSGSDATSKPPSTNPNSDMAAALKESKQRKNIAPRTHG